MDKMKKQMAPDLQAKTDVLKALRKLAMEMMAQDPEGEDGAVMAKLQMKKVEPEMIMGSEEESEEQEEELEDEENEEESSDSASMLKKLLK